MPTEAGAWRTTWRANSSAPCWSGGQRLPDSNQPMLAVLFASLPWQASWEVVRHLRGCDWHQRRCRAACSDARPGPQCCCQPCLPPSTCSSGVKAADGDSIQVYLTNDLPVGVSGEPCRGLGMLLLRPATGLWKACPAAFAPDPDVQDPFLAPRHPDSGCDPLCRHPTQPSCATAALGQLVHCRLCQSPRLGGQHQV